jgi:hypothetical protein
LNAQTPDEVIGTAVIVSGPGSQYDWLQYLYQGRNINGISWDELPLLYAEAPAVIGERLPAHFKEQRPWRYEVEEDLPDAAQMIVVSPSINKANGYWHNEGRWRVRAVRLDGMAHTYSGRQRAIISTLIAHNLPEHIAELQAFSAKIYGTPPLQT